MIRRRVHDEDDLLPAENQDLDVVEGRDPNEEREQDARLAEARVSGERSEDASGRLDNGDPQDEPYEGSDEDREAEVEADVEDEPRGEDADEEFAASDEELDERGADLAAVPEFPEDPSPAELARLRLMLEAVLFASTEALTPSRLAEVLRVSVEHVKTELQALADELEAEGRPYELRPHGGAWRLYTREEFYPYLLRLKSLKKVEKLTPAALETLAIVAYRQPVIRAEIEAIRGVRSGPLLRALLDRKLIRVLGRAEVPGAPLQYGTTQRFLDRFGLASLKDLPSLKEFRQGRI